MSHPSPASPERRATVVVIGAGQAGLSAGYHLLRRGFVSALEQPGAERSVVVLDAEDAPGGAWRHRWASLTMETVNGIFDLPGMAQEPVAPAAPSREAVPAYFSRFEQAMDLPILRPVRVRSVRETDADSHGDLLVETTVGTWRTCGVINASGTWNSPRLPAFPGAETFRGRRLHTRDYVAAEEFAGQRVAVVGGGISAIQHLEEISRVARTRWYTRGEPVFREGPFEPETTGRAVIARVTADVEAGHPTGSVVSYTGLGWFPAAVAARDRGVLVRHPVFTRIVPEGVVEVDGTVTELDAILWATGFTPSIAHLDPLGLRNAEGGIVLRGTLVAAEPRLHLVGYGPSQSTVGANRAGRRAARELDRFLAGTGD